MGRKNHIEIEINGSKGSICFDFEDMNRLKYFNGDDPKDRQGFRDILVTERDGVQPYVSNWWPPGHIIGYEHTFVHVVGRFRECLRRRQVHAAHLRRRFEEPARAGSRREIVEGRQVGVALNVYRRRFVCRTAGGNLRYLLGLFSLFDAVALGVSLWTDPD